MIEMLNDMFQSRMDFMSLLILGGILFGSFAGIWVLLKMVFSDDEEGGYIDQIKSQKAATRTKNEQFAYLRDQVVLQTHNLANKIKFDLVFFLVLLGGFLFAVAMLYLTAKDRDSLVTLILTVFVCVNLFIYRAKRTKEEIEELTNIREWISLRKYDGQDISKAAPVEGDSSSVKGEFESSDEDVDLDDLEVPSKADEGAVFSVSDDEDIKNW